MKCFLVECIHKQKASIWHENMLGYLSADINYLLREENSIPKAKLEENCELESILETKWRLLC